MENILTIGITTHGNRVSKEIISFLKGSNVSVIISEDKDIDSEFIPDYVNELSQSGTDTKYVFSKKSGIANNRQNILDNVKTKYFYTIDNDDVLKGNLTELTNFLSNNDYDIISIKCYEDGHYMHIPKDFFYMCTWMQIFKTDWFKGLGGYIQSWNFIHEECATNLNMKVNNGRKNYSKKIISKKILSYYYHANSACNVTFDIQQVCNFIEKIPNNSKIEKKKNFLNMFLQFAQKYMPVYRVNETEVTYLKKLENGSFDDIYKKIYEVMGKLNQEDECGL